MAVTRTTSKKQTEDIKQKLDEIPLVSFLTKVLTFLVGETPEEQVVSLLPGGGLGTLFHGTSALRIPAILERGIQAVRTGDFGDPALKRFAAFLTDSPSVAGFFSVRKAEDDLTRLRRLLAGGEGQLAGHPIESEFKDLFRNAFVEADVPLKVRRTLRARIDPKDLKERALQFRGDVPPETIKRIFIDPDLGVDQASISDFLVSLTKDLQDKTNLSRSEINSVKNEILTRLSNSNRFSFTPGERFVTGKPLFPTNLMRPPLTILHTEAADRLQKAATPQERKLLSNLLAGAKDIQETLFQRDLARKRGVLAVRPSDPLKTLEKVIKTATKGKVADSPLSKETAKVFLRVLEESGAKKLTPQEARKLTERLQQLLSAVSEATGKPRGVVQDQLFGLLPKKK